MNTLLSNIFLRYILYAFPIVYGLFGILENSVKSHTVLVMIAAMLITGSFFPVLPSKKVYKIETLLFSAIVCAVFFKMNAQTASFESLAPVYTLYMVIVYTMIKSFDTNTATRIKREYGIAIVGILGCVVSAVALFCLDNTYDFLSRYLFQFAVLGTVLVFRSSVWNNWTSFFVPLCQDQHNDLWSGIKHYGIVFNTLAFYTKRHPKDALSALNAFPLESLLLFIENTVELSFSTDFKTLLRNHIMERDERARWVWQLYATDAEAAVAMRQLDHASCASIRSYPNLELPVL